MAVGDLFVQGLNIRYTEPVLGKWLFDDGLNFSIKRGGRLCIAGPSGIGKSSILFALLGILPKSSQVQGIVGIEGLGVDFAGSPVFRGKGFACLFQQPRTYMNPMMRVIDQVTDSAVLVREMTKEDAYAEALALLKKMGMEGRFAFSYPFQLSGGMAQRAMLAQALILRPKVLLLDEPTSALDASLRKQALDLILDLQTEFGFSMILISHNESVVRYVGGDVLRLSGLTACM